MKVWKVGLHQMKATTWTVKEPQLRNIRIYFARVNTPCQLLSSQLLLSKLSMNNNYYLGTYMYYKKKFFQIEISLKFSVFAFVLQIKYNYYNVLNINMSFTWYYGKLSFFLRFYFCFFYYLKRYEDKAIQEYS